MEGLDLRFRESGRNFRSNCGDALLRHLGAGLRRGRPRLKGKGTENEGIQIAKNSAR
jgi:hypothetical protein